MASHSGWNINPYKMAGMLGTDVAKLVLGKLINVEYVFAMTEI